LNAHYSYITNQESLHQLCAKISAERVVAFDTEFVAEDSYKPELCLVQVAVGGDVAIIDPYPCGDLSPFWDTLVDPLNTVIVHAGREETLFCYRATKKLIPNLFDIQWLSRSWSFESPMVSWNHLIRETKSLEED
jgi:ribonuclease D